MTARFTNFGKLSRVESVDVKLINDAASSGRDIGLSAVDTGPDSSKLTGSMRGQSYLNDMRLILSDMHCPIGRTRSVR